jgi:hypothetical protein
MYAVPNEDDDERHFTEEEYAAADKLSDRQVGLYLLVITIATIAAGLLAAVTGLSAGLSGILVVIPAALWFLFRSDRKTRDLPRQRQAIRPVRVRWVLTRFVAVLGTMLAVVIVIALVAAL